MGAKDKHTKEEMKKILKKKSGKLEGLPKKLKNKIYNREIERLQTEMVKLEEWIKFKGLKVVVLFEGRDAAGKGGVIRRITARTNPRIVRIAALGTPTEREKTQWYFQRYAAYLPAAGEGLQDAGGGRPDPESTTLQAAQGEILKGAPGTGSGTIRDDGDRDGNLHRIGHSPRGRMSRCRRAGPDRRHAALEQ